MKATGSYDDQANITFVSAWSYLDETKLIAYVSELPKRMFKISPRRVVPDGY